MEEAFGLRAAAIATYPMYRGLASLVGMDVLETGDSIADEFDTLEKKLERLRFFFICMSKKPILTAKTAIMKRNYKSLRKPTCKSQNYLNSIRK